MLRKIWLILGILAIAAVLSGLGASYWLGPRSYKWTEISPDNRFRASIPGSPLTSQAVDKSSDGRAFATNRIRSTPAHGVVYQVSWWENPTQKDESTEELFSHFRDCNIKAVNGLVTEKNTEVQGYPAKYSSVIGPKGLLVWNLTVRVGPRIYSLFVLDPSGFRDKDNIQKFFKSLTLS